MGTVLDSTAAQTDEVQAEAEHPRDSVQTSSAEKSDSFVDEAGFLCLAGEELVLA